MKKIHPEDVWLIFVFIVGFGAVFLIVSGVIK